MVLCEAFVLIVEVPEVTGEILEALAVFLLAVVLFYQVVGTLGEWAFFTDGFYAAVQDFRIGIPGMLLQVFGGYAFIRYLIQK